MSESLRVGVVGVGNIGSVHAKSITLGKIPAMTLTALCDTDPERRGQLQKEYPTVPIYESYQELLSAGITDVVIVSTPHYDHPIIALDALRAGQHVLIEKPAGVYASAVRELNEEAEKSGKVFGIMFNQRTDPLFAKAREIVQSGKLGQPKRLVWIVTNWYRTQYYYNSGSWRATWNGEGGGVLLNQAPHNLDLWQWIFGMPKRIRAFCEFGKYHHIAVEDDVTIYAEYENGANATFITTTGETPGTNRLEISGDLGKLVLEEGCLKWWKLAEPEREFCFTSEQGFYQPKTEVIEYREPAPEGHIEILKNYADAILNGAELIAPGIDGLNELSISNAAYLSAWTNDWAELPVDDERFESLLRQRCEQEVIEKTGSKESGFSEEYHERWQVRW